MMKSYPKLKPYRLTPDAFSELMMKYHFELHFFTHFPSQSNKELKNLLISQIKVILIEEGECEIHFQDSTMKLEKNDICIIPPMTLHSAKTSDSYLSSYEIFFNVNPLVHEIQFLDALGLKQAVCCKGALTQQLQVQLETCYEAVRQHRETSYFQLLGCLAQVLASLVQEKPLQLDNSQGGQEKEKIVKEMTAFVSEHLDRNITTHDLCEHLSISQSYLYRCVQSVLHTSPSHFIVQVKMTRAERMLKDMSLSIGEIACQLGYENIYYFSTTFKKEFGISPSEYRQSHKANFLSGE